MLNPDDVDFIIYHNPCSDGTGSAWVAWKYLTDKHPERQVVYYPTNYGRPPPDVTGRNVLICDFSYKAPVLLNMIQSAKNLYVIDHHKTASKDLMQISDNYKLFDMDRSGAMLTWMYFFPFIKPPLMIEYIQDRDIWTNKLPLIEAFASWFWTLEHDVVLYDKFSDDNLFMNMINTQGVAMLAKDQNYIQQATPYGSVKFQKIDNKFLFVAYLNTTVLKSDIGNSVITRFKYADFAAVYSINDYNDSTSFSLRSTDDHFDCSSVATTSFLNGGGHRNASGIKLPYVTNTLPGVVFDNNRLYQNLEKINYDVNFMNIFNVVYACSQSYQKELGIYLLQDKYEEQLKNQEGVISVQESTSIFRIRDELPDLNIRFHIAAVWSYDPNRDQTCYQLILDRSLSQEHIDMISNKLNLNENNTVIYPGVAKFLFVE